MATLICSIILLSVIVTGLAHIVHPPAGREIAKRTARVALALFAAQEILSYLWTDRLGRLLLIGTALIIVAILARGRKEKLAFSRRRR